MRFGVEVLPDDEFAVWLSKQQAIEGVTTS
jgi:hypothetical protein